VASWDQVKSYIGANYTIASDDGNLIKLVFELEGGRTQMVLVTYNATHAGIEFAMISSPIAEVGTVDLVPLLREASERVVGGVVAYGNNLMLRHAVPLADLDASDFDTPLQLVTAAADSIEAKFLGTDEF